jgi:hypothetical protein
MRNPSHPTGPWRPMPQRLSAEPSQPFGCGFLHRKACPARRVALLVDSARMDRPTLLGVIAALIVIAVFAINGWWIELAALSVVSALLAVLAWRVGLPMFRAQDE